MLSLAADVLLLAVDGSVAVAVVAIAGSFAEAVVDVANVAVLLSTSLFMACCCCCPQCHG